MVWPHVISRCNPLWFLASKKGGIGGGGQVSPRGAMHMAAALTGCRKALVGTGSLLDKWAEIRLLCASLRTPFLALLTVFSWEKHLLVREP